MPDRAGWGSLVSMLIHGSALAQPLGFALARAATRSQGVPLQLITARQCPLPAYTLHFLQCRLSPLGFANWRAASSCRLGVAPETQDCR
jgi:hypothetical protein